MQNSNPELSIIIVNYRSEQYLKSCVASLFKYLKNIRFEIIVVNNDVSESLAEINKNFPEIKVIGYRQNIGFGAGCNLGAKSAQGEVLLFLNPDTEAVSFALVELFNKLKNSEDIAVIGPRLLTIDNKTQWWCAGKEVTGWQLVKNNFGIIESKKIWESPKEIFSDWVSGAAMFVKKEVFDQLSGFNEKFFMYGEDLDLCRRIKKAGWLILYYPEVSVIHLGGKSRQSFLKQKSQFFRSTLRYLFKK